MRLSILLGLVVGSWYSLELSAMNKEVGICQGYEVGRLNSILSQTRLSARDMTEIRRLIASLELGKDFSKVHHYRLLYEKYALQQMMGTDEEHRPYVVS